MTLSADMLSAALRPNTDSRTTLAADPAGTDPTQREAWLREMERSQLSAWFSDHGSKPSDRTGQASDRLSARSSEMAPVPGQALAPVAPVPTDSGSEIATFNATSNSAAPSVPFPTVTRMSASAQQTQALRPYGILPSAANEARPSEAAQRAVAGNPAAFDRGVSDSSNGLGNADAKIEAVVNNAMPTPRSIVAASLALLLDVRSSNVVEPLLADASAVEQATLASASESHGGDEVESPAETGAGSLRSTQGVASDVRLHAEWHGDDADVWLGMSGSAQQIQDQVALIVPQLSEHLLAQGRRLGRVVCNGQLLYDPTSSGLASPVADFSQIMTRQQLSQFSTYSQQETP